MGRRGFKSHVIVRSNPPQKSPYTCYKLDLEQDFHERCAYCNLHKHSVAISFEIDHFIPVKTFRGVRDDLREDYTNLVYACKKCNRAKGSQFSGDIKSDTVTNEKFYDPVEVDYNTIFYRNEYGAIASDDAKGRDMIADIKLYRPIHMLGWICEQFCQTKDKLDYEISHESDPNRKVLLEQVKLKIAEKYMDYARIFNATYNDPNFSFSDFENNLSQ